MKYIHVILVRPCYLQLNVLIRSVLFYFLATIDWKLQIPVGCCLILFLYQFLQVTNPDLVQNKSSVSGRLTRGKSQDEIDKVTSTPEKPELNVPLVEALFLPDFPIKGDAQGNEFEVQLMCILIKIYHFSIKKYFDTKKPKW